MNGKGLRRALKELKLSQLAFAKQVGIPTRTVQNWLSKDNENKHLVNTQNALKILDYLSYEALNPGSQDNEEIEIGSVKEKFGYTIKLACDFTPFYSIQCLITKNDSSQIQERFSVLLEKIMLSEREVDVFDAHDIFRKILDIAMDAEGNTGQIASKLYENETINNLLQTYFENQIHEAIFIEYDSSKELQKIDLEQTILKIESFENQLKEMLTESIKLKSYLKKHLKSSS